MLVYIFFISFVADINSARPGIKQHMNSKFFYTIVLALFLSSAYFMYQFAEFRPLAEDQTNVEMAIATGNSGSADASRDDINRIDREDQVIRLQSYGYLAGAVFFILCPTLMFIYRRKLIRL
jgi:hypothetical protein